MAAATLVRPDADAPEPPGPDGLLLAFMRLCRQLERPVTEAELRAVATPAAAGADLACLGRMAERLGFTLRTVRMSAAALARVPTPCLIIGREQGRAWLVRARTHDQVVLVEPVHGGATACTIKVAAGFGDRLMRLVPGRRQAAARASGARPCCAACAACSGRSAWHRW